MGDARGASTQRERVFRILEKSGGFSGDELAELRAVLIETPDGTLSDVEQLHLIRVCELAVDLRRAVNATLSARVGGG